MNNCFVRKLVKANCHFHMKDSCYTLFFLIIWFFFTFCFDFSVTFNAYCYTRQWQIHSQLSAKKMPKSQEI